MDDKQQEQKSSDKITKRIRLIARILTTFFTAYAIMMMIGYLISWVTTGTADPYAVEDYPFIENLPPIFMLLAIIGLGIGWRYAKLGGLINIIFCITGERSKEDYVMRGIPVGNPSLFFFSQYR